MLPQSRPGDPARAFDPARLTQARQLAGLTRKELSGPLGLTPAAVGQYEAGITSPRPDLLPRLAALLAVPPEFFAGGRPHAKLDVSMTHFRGLRSTRLAQREQAVAFASQVWEVAHALERRIELPPVRLPGFAGGEVTATEGMPGDPAGAAAALRRYWGLGNGRIAHLVRTMEAHGIVVTMLPRESGPIDAFSTSRLPRPLVVLTLDRAGDVYRHRFTAAHELGHLVLHGDAAPGDPRHEREADAFAAEFLTPRERIAAELPARVDLGALAALQRTWGVSVQSLVYRARELGLLSSSAAGRAYQRLTAWRADGGLADEPVDGYPGECPALLTRAFALAAQNGTTIGDLAGELALPAARVRDLLGLPTTRPALRLVR